MTALEIVLVVVGIVLFIGSFFITEKFTASSEQIKANIDVNELKKLIKHQINEMNDEIETAISEVVENSTGGVQRSMEKMSNEKIMAINEYSNTVMDLINKNHNEAMFLYGMLNDKNKEIKDTAELIMKANKGFNKKINEAQIVIDKMDTQISELNKVTDKQKESMDKLSKSAKTIEILEEQINNIEQMALQFSKDIKSSELETNIKKVQMLNNDYNSDISDKEESKEELEVSLFNLDESDFENHKVFEEFEQGDSTEDLEEFFGGFSKTEDYIKEQETSNNNNKILNMSKEGQTAREIARNLGLGVGEVQLVIDLFKGGRR